MALYDRCRVDTHSTGADDSCPAVSIAGGEVKSYREDSFLLHKSADTADMTRHEMVFTPEDCGRIPEMIFKETAPGMVLVPNRSHGIGGFEPAVMLLAEYDREGRVLAVHVQEIPDANAQKGNLQFDCTGTRRDVWYRKAFLVKLGENSPLYPAWDALALPRE